MKALISSIGIILAISLASGQINSDSILKVLPTIENDSARANIYIQLAEVYFPNDPLLAIKYVDSAATVKAIADNILNNAKINYFYGAALTKLNKFDSAALP